MRGRGVGFKELWFIERELIYRADGFTQARFWFNVRMDDKGKASCVRLLNRNFKNFYQIFL